MNNLTVPQKYIGIPFKEGGTDITGLDCINLAKLFVENERGIKVNRMPPTAAAEKNKEKYRELIEPFLLHELIPGDVVFFSFPGNRWHCGIYTGYGKLLHIVRPIFDHKKSHSLISPILPQWRQYYFGAIRTQGKTEINLPEAGALGLIALIITIATTIASIVMALTAPKPSLPSFGNDSGSPKYGFDAISNTISNALIYPIHFGSNKYGGNIIWHKEIGETIIKEFIVLGIGQINSISDVRVNDIPIATLPGCSYTAYLGTSEQTVDSRAGGEVYGLRNVAYLALTIQSSDKLPGGNTVVTCVVEGLIMKTWNGSTWTGNTYSRNPAACLRKLLTIAREDGGPEVDEAEIDDAAFGEAYDYFAALVDNGAGGTHARGQFDFVFDAEKPVHDAISDILKTYGMHLLVGEKISLKVLKAEDSVFNFDENNIDADSFKYFQTSKNDSYNEVIAQYSDPDQNDVTIETAARDQLDQINTGVVRSETFSFLGLNRFAEASRRAEFIKNESNVNTWLCEFTVDIDALHCAIGDVVTVTHSLPAWSLKPFRIINITEEENYKRKVTLKEENSSIYNDALGSVIETYDYGSPPNAYAPVTDVTGLLLSESPYYLHKDGKASSDILVSWAAPADQTARFLKQYQVELKKESGEYEIIGYTSSLTWTIFGVQEAKNYYVRIKTISLNDVKSDGTASSAIYILGKEQPPSDVTGFEVYQEGNMLRASWNPIPDPDLGRYEVRKGSEWATGDIIGEKIDTTDFMWPVGEIGNIRFMVKAFDRSENESVNPAIDDVEVIPPPDMNFVNNFDRWSLPFDYILSNLEIVQANYHNAGFVRPCLALNTATTWEEREAEAKPWDQQEAEGGLLLDSTVEASGYAEMVYPLDLGTLFTFKLIVDADYKNVTGGSVTIQISISEDGINYSSFAEISATALYRARYLKFKIIIETTDTAYNLYLYGLTIYINAPQVRKSWGQDVAIPIGSKDLVFDAGFTIAPRFFAIVSNGVSGYVTWAKTDLTKDGNKVYVKDFAGSAIGTAEINWEASGT